MNITSKTVTMTATEDTELASFQIEYIIQNDKLFSAQFNIYKPKENEEEVERQHIGYVSVENDTYTCNIPFGEDTVHIFTSIAGYMEKILLEIEPTGEDYSNENQVSQTN